MKTQIKVTILLFTILTILSCSKDDDDNNTSQLFLNKLNGQQFKEVGYDDAFLYFSNGNEITKQVEIAPEENCIVETSTQTLDGKNIDKYFGEEEVEEIYLDIKLHSENKLIIEGYFLALLNTPQHTIIRGEFEYNNNRVYETYNWIDPTTQDVTYSSQLVYEKSSVNLPTSFCQ